MTTVNFKHIGLHPQSNNSIDLCQFVNNNRLSDSEVIINESDTPTFIQNTQNQLQSNLSSTSGMTASKHHIQHQGLDERTYSLYQIGHQYSLMSAQLHPEINKIFMNQNVQNKFCYRIRGKHQILKNIIDFNKLFEQIRLKSNIRQIILDFDQKIPIKSKGAIINIIDQNEQNLKNALRMLLQYFCQIDKARYSQHKTDKHTITIIIPEMLVPVVMGKQGKLISRIKLMTNTSITVRGPFNKFIYQDVQISSNQLENIINACYLMYNIAYKVLKKQSIRICTNNLNYFNSLQNRIINTAVYNYNQHNQEYTKVGICVDGDLFNKIWGYSGYCLYQYMNSIRANCKSKILIQTVEYVKELTKYSKWIRGFRITGKLSDVKVALYSIVQLIFFQGSGKQDLQLLITQSQAKNLTNYYGKFLRDISSKSLNTYIQIISKGQQQSRFIISGNMEGKLKAAYMVIEFLYYFNAIIQRQKTIKPINYQVQLQEIVLNNLQKYEIMPVVKRKMTKKNKNKYNKNNKNNKKYDFKFKTKRVNWPDAIRDRQCEFSKSQSFKATMQSQQLYQ